MNQTLESGIAPKFPRYTKAQARREAERCLYCYDPPCVKACPTSIDIPTFIKKIATDNLLSSAKTILTANILGASCARVCPVEVLCAGACVYHDLHEPPIEIGRLQDYATGYAQETLSPVDILGPKATPTQKSVALVGAGPASLAAAALLAHASIKPVIFEKHAVAGGLNTYGIAPYKLKCDESHKEIDWLATLGIEFRLGIEVGDADMPEKMVSWKTLERDFDAIFVGCGLGADNALPIDGLIGPGVVGACDIIAQIKTDENFSLAHVTRAHVIGGGNTAMDIAHELKLLGVKEVTVLYRKSIREMSAYEHELVGIRKAGVYVQEYVELRDVIRDERGLVGIKTTVSDALIESDLVVLAIGQQSAQQHMSLNAPLSYDNRGRIVVNPQTFRVEGKKIWACGDGVNGGKEVVFAVSEAKLAVADMIKTICVKEEA